MNHDLSTIEAERGCLIFPVEPQEHLCEEQPPGVYIHELSSTLQAPARSLGAF